MSQVVLSIFYSPYLPKGLQPFEWGSSIISYHTVSETFSSTFGDTIPQKAENHALCPPTPPPILEGLNHG
jgi:hypothetical protein